MALQQWKTGLQGLADLWVMKHSTFSPSSFLFFFFCQHVRQFRKNPITSLERIQKSISGLDWRSFDWWFHRPALTLQQLDRIQTKVKWLISLMQGSLKEKRSRMFPKTETVWGPKIPNLTPHWECPQLPVPFSGMNEQSRLSFHPTKTWITVTW